MISHEPSLHRDCAALVSTHPRAKLLASLGVSLLGLCLGPGCLETRSEDAQSCFVVGALASAVNADDETAREMLEYTTGIGLVLVLASWTLTSGELHVQVPWIDVNLMFAGFCEDGYGDGAGVDAASFLGRRDTLPTMASGFVLECCGSSFALDAGE